MFPSRQDDGLLSDIPLIDFGIALNPFTKSFPDDPPLFPMMLSPDVQGGDLLHVEDGNEDVFEQQPQSEPVSASITGHPSQNHKNHRRKSATRQHLHLTHRSPDRGRSDTMNQSGEESSSTFFSPPLTNGTLTGEMSGSSQERPRVQPCCGAEVNRMKWRIKFFFMDPIQKWKTRHQFPWKLFLQVIKIVFVTIQVREGCLFGWNFDLFGHYCLVLF